MQQTKPKLTIKQERFCQLFVETGNASEAYRRAYDCKSTYATINVKACEMLRKDNISVRVSELQQAQQAKASITKDEIMRLCIDVIRGKVVTDYVEERAGKQLRRAVSKTWAVERLCKMLGWDAPTKQDITVQPAPVFDLSLVPDDVVCEIADKLLDYRDLALLGENTQGDDGGK